MGASGYYHGLGLNHFPAAVQPLYLSLQLNGIHAGALYLQPKALRLLLHVRAYGEAVYAVREAGIVIHLCRLCYLASYQHVLKEHSIHAAPCTIEPRRKPCRPAAYYRYIVHIMSPKDLLYIFYNKADRLTTGDFAGLVIYQSITINGHPSINPYLTHKSKPERFKTPQTM